MWLYVPSEHLASAPEPGGSTSAYEWRSLLLAQSCTWNMKLRPASSWSRAWRTAPLIRRLYGLISEPLTAGRGVESWIASLGGYPVSPTVSPASDSEPQTNATSGPIQPVLSGMSTLNGSSWRTCQQCSPTSFIAGCQSYRRWATWLRRRSSRLRTSARRTSANASSSWPTPDTMPEAPNSGTNKKSDTASLGEMAKNWPTPLDNDAKQHANRDGMAPTLTQAAAMWPTATAHDGRRPGSEEGSTQGRNLKREAEQWQTPGTAQRKLASVDLTRAARLRLTGNGVVPQQAALAWRILKARFVT